jgi:hypothetical protein
MAGIFFREKKQWSVVFVKLVRVFVIFLFGGVGMAEAKNYIWSDTCFLKNGTWEYKLCRQVVAHSTKIDCAVALDQRQSIRQILSRPGITTPWRAAAHSNFTNSGLDFIPNARTFA